MPDALVIVCTVAGRLEADRIQSWLEAEGIPAMVSQESAEAAYSLTVGTFGLADILVPASRADEAKALLAAMRSGELEQPSGDGDPPEGAPPSAS
jgi:hypothetical protein